MHLTEDLEVSLQRAYDRKKYLRAVLKNLIKQVKMTSKEYSLVKEEIKIREARLEKKISESEFSGFLDTVKIEMDQLRFLKTDE